MIVLDELPWLATGEPALEGMLQTAWDRHLSRVPVLLVELGSDLSMMERLGEYGRPLYQRMRELVLEPLNVRETGELCGLDPTQSFDAQLVAGRISADPAGLARRAVGDGLRRRAARRVHITIGGDRGTGAQRRVSGDDAGTCRPVGRRRR
ncbi:MAG: hypothetical protein ACRDRH_07490 [Pseudonocardia sp.]